MITETYDAVIVGTGTAGSIISKELSLRNKKILILEQGDIQKHIGQLKYALNFYNFSNILKLPKKTVEGIPVYQGIASGGTTVVSTMNAVVSLKEELLKLGIDIHEELIQIQEEIPVTPTEPRLYSEATRHIIQASKEMGLNMQAMPKFLKNKKCKKCGNCVYGCIYGAKWSGSKLLQSKLLREKVLYNAKVYRVISENGTAAGLEYFLDGNKKVALANQIILSAGAISTPQILMNSNIRAGSNFSLDLFVNVYGYSDRFNQLDEPVMPVASFDNYISKGFIISPFVNSSYLARFIEGGLSVARLPRKGLVGLMVKIKDDSNGTIKQDGVMSKPVTVSDKTKIAEGVNVSREILRKIGVKNKNISISKIQGAHPAGTAAIGDVIDSSFQTSMKNLFVCDASMLPESPGLPPMLTIMALSKKLSKQLD